MTGELDHLNRIAVGTEHFCPNCEAYHETCVERRQHSYVVRGRHVTVNVTARVCTKCGGVIGSDEEDQAVLDAVWAEYRRMEQQPAR